MSRLKFRCIHCGTSGFRAETYKPLPRQVPGFVDICPSCRSTDIEVYDPELVEAPREALS